MTLLMQRRRMGAMKMGEKLSRLIGDRGLVQRKVEQRAQLPANKISKLTGDKPPAVTLREALALARLLSVPLDWLVDDAQDYPPPSAHLGADEVDLVRVYRDEVRRGRLNHREAVARLTADAPSNPVRTSLLHSDQLDELTRKLVGKADQEAERPERKD